MGRLGYRAHLSITREWPESGPAEGAPPPVTKRLQNRWPATCLQTGDRPVSWRAPPDRLLMSGSTGESAMFRCPPARRWRAGLPPQASCLLTGESVCLERDIPPPRAIRPTSHAPPLFSCSLPVGKGVLESMVHTKNLFFSWLYISNITTQSRLEKRATRTTSM